MRHFVALGALLLVTASTSVAQNPCGCPYITVDDRPVACVRPTADGHVLLSCKDDCSGCCSDGTLKCSWLCAGDCNGNRRVTVDELTRAVGIFVTQTGVNRCVNADVDRDGQLTVSELVRAVGVALNGCD